MVDQVESGGNLDKDVAKWLMTHGYRLEFETAKAFEATGLCVTMGQFVTSNDGQRREVDVCAHATAWPNNVTHFGMVRIVCECKYSEQPWVLLYGGETSAPIGLLGALRTTSVKPYGDSESLKQIEATFHFKHGVPLAHGAVQALRKMQQDADRAYAALMKSVDSALAMVHELDYMSKASESQIYFIGLPLVVVSFPLFAAKYDDDAGELSVRRISWGRVAWRGAARATEVDIVTSEHLSIYAPQAADSAREIAAALRYMVDSGSAASNPNVPA